MGHMGAVSMVEEAGVNYHTMKWHLQNNHYPPHPEYMIPFALKAVKYANKGDFNHMLIVPKQTTFRGKRKCSVYDACESMHLDAFINYEDEY